MTARSDGRSRDLQDHLGAWLGDVSAHDLFVGWESERIDRRLGAVGRGAGQGRADPGDRRRIDRETPGDATDAVGAEQT